METEVGATDEGAKAPETTIAWERITVIATMTAAAAGLAIAIAPRPAHWELVSAALAVILVGVSAISVNVGIAASNPKLLYDGSWRLAHAHARVIRKGLMRSMLLASITLALAATLIATLLAQGYAPENTVLMWIGHIVMTSAMVTCAASVGLPQRAFAMRHRQLKDAVDARRPGGALYRAQEKTRQTGGDRSRS